MGILDDAIREHLDLKRKHGARDAELREIEDEAFGSGEQPDPFAAAAGDLMNDVAATEAAPGESGPSAAASGLATPPPHIREPNGRSEEPTRLVEPAEPISPPEGLEQAPEVDEPIPPPEPLEEPIPGQERLEEPIPGQERLPEPEQEEEADVPPAAPEEPPSSGLEPPAPSESLEELIAEEEPFPEDAEAPEPGSPPEPRAGGGDLLPRGVDEMDEPGLGAERSVPDPPPPPPPGSEPPGRARGRVDVPTQEHPPPGETGGLPPLPAEEPEAAAPEADAPEAGGPALYDFETDEDLLEPVVPAGDTDDDFEALGPAEEGGPYLEEEEPDAEEPGPSAEAPAEEAYEGGALELEESYEEGEDDLWFEKGPPKDFDFEDEDEDR